MTRLDTHVVAWLYAGEVDRFTPAARTLLDDGELVISPVVQLELTFLHEIGRLAVAGDVIVADLRGRIGLSLSERPLTAVVVAAAGLSWTRDPFDRLIVGDAVAANTPLLTKDASILKHCPLARWGDRPPQRRGRSRSPGS